MCSTYPTYFNPSCRAPNPCINRRGPPGPTGSTGSTGASGLTGPTGPAGSGGAVMTPTRTLFVSPVWSSPASPPFFTDIQPAITYAQTLVPAPSPSAPVEIIIYTGIYTNPITLQNGVYLTGYDDATFISTVSWTPTSAVSSEFVELNRLHITGLTINTTGKGGLTTISGDATINDCVLSGATSITTRGLEDAILVNKSYLVPALADSFTVGSSTTTVSVDSSIFGLGTFTMDGILSIVSTFFVQATATVAPANQFTVATSGQLAATDCRLTNITSSGVCTILASQVTGTVSISANRTITFANTNMNILTITAGRTTISACQIDTATFTATANVTSEQTKYNTSLTVDTGATFSGSDNAVLADVFIGTTSSSSFTSPLSSFGSLTVAHSSTVIIDNSVCFGSTSISGTSTFHANGMTYQGSVTVDTGSSITSLNATFLGTTIFGNTATVAAVVSGSAFTAQLVIDHGTTYTGNNCEYAVQVSVGATSVSSATSNNSTFTNGFIVSNGSTITCDNSFINFSTTPITQAGTIFASDSTISAGDITFSNPVTMNDSTISATSITINNPATLNNSNVSASTLTANDVLTANGTTMNVPTFTISPVSTNFNSFNNSSITTTTATLANNNYANNSTWNVSSSFIINSPTGAVYTDDSSFVFRDPTAFTDIVSITCPYYQSQNSKYTATSFPNLPPNFINIVSGTTDMSGAVISCTGATNNQYINITAGASLKASGSTILAQGTAGAMPNMINCAGYLDISNGIVSSPQNVNTQLINVSGTLVGINASFNFPSTVQLFLVSGKANLLGMKATQSNSVNPIVDATSTGQVDRDFDLFAHSVTWVGAGPVGSATVTFSPAMNDVAYDVSFVQITTDNTTPIIFTSLVTGRTTSSFQIMNQGTVTNGVVAATLVAGTATYDFHITRQASTIG